MVARLDPIDQADLLRAFAQVHQPDWQLHLVGDGPADPLLQLIQQLGLTAGALPRTL